MILAIRRSAATVRSSHFLRSSPKAHREGPTEPGGQEVCSDVWNSLSDLQDVHIIMQGCLLNCTSRFHSRRRPNTVESAVCSSLISSLFSFTRSSRRHELFSLSIPHFALC